jgi:hypothetical protein
MGRTSYVDGLHRGAAKRLHCGLTLECCRTDDAITTVPGDEAAVSLATQSAAQSASRSTPVCWRNVSARGA